MCFCYITHLNDHGSGAPKNISRACATVTIQVLNTNIRFVKCVNICIYLFIFNTFLKKHSS